jgi:hypothetical protein
LDEEATPCIAQGPPKNRDVAATNHAAVRSRRIDRRTRTKPYNRRVGGVEEEGRWWWWWEWFDDSIKKFRVGTERFGMYGAAGESLRGDRKIALRNLRIRHPYWVETILSKGKKRSPMAPLSTLVAAQWGRELGEGEGRVATSRSAL